MMSPPIQAVFFDLGDTLVTASRSWVPGAQRALSLLEDAGIRLGLLSNTGNLTREELAQHLPVDFDLSRFEDALIVLSSEVGAEKPSAQIFGLAIDRASVSPLQALFCGERLSETLAAQRAGMLSARVSVHLEGNRVVGSDVAELARQVVAL